MVYSNGPSIVRDGLVLHLDAADRNSYPRSGTSWGDLSGNGNNGTLTNGPTFSSNDRGSIVFDGSNDYIELGDVLDLGTNDMTMIVWLSLSSTPSVADFFLSKSRAAAQNYRFALSINTSNKPYTFFQGNGGSDIQPVANQSILTNKFYMITSVIDRSSNISMYINESIQTLSGNSTISQWNSLDFQSNNPLRIGSYTNADNTSTQYPFDGKISQVLIYHKVLSADEISQNYNATKGRFGL